MAFGGSSVFSGCSSLKSIWIPASFPCYAKVRRDLFSGLRHCFVLMRECTLRQFRSIA
jgi:hypothetical protein